MNKRLISYNILLTHELLHHMRTHKIRALLMALKMDLSKAYDRVEWNDLIKEMEKIWFNSQWRQLIFHCI